MSCIVLGEPISGLYLISYTSPTIIFCALFLMLFFANIRCNQSLIRFIKYFAPVSFGVYLFQEEPLIRETLIKNAFVHYLSFNPFVMSLAVIVTALCIWLIGSLIDRIRLTIFNVFKVREFCIWVVLRLSRTAKCENTVSHE